MLTPGYLDALPDQILDLYERYTVSVLNDIARRLAGMHYASAGWQMQRLTESGMVYEQALERLAKLTGQSEQALRETFQRAGVRALRYDDSVYRAAGLDPLPLNLSPAMARVLAAGLRKTGGQIRNLTQTTALSGQEAFIRAADLIHTQITTGAFDYQSALRAGIKQVASEGLTVIHYSGRRDQLDVALRRAVLTGVNQTASELSWARADEMGSDLVQVSAHAGARPSHAVWQGKIYSRSGAHPRYPDFRSSTGYGTGAGLGGWNCRHSFYPFFEGLSESAYDRQDLKEMNEKTVTYQGQKLSQYEASQIQRGIERKIRYWKRQAAALEAGGLDNTFEMARVGEWQARARDLTRQTGLKRQYIREQVYPNPKRNAFPLPAPRTPPPGPAPAPQPPIPTPVQPAVPSAVQPFKPARTFAKANDYARSVLGIPFVDYRGANLKIANEWNRALTETFDRMPELRGWMSAIGSARGRRREEVKRFVQIFTKQFQNLAGRVQLTPLEQQFILTKARQMAIKIPKSTLAFSIRNSKIGLDGVFVNGAYKYKKLQAILQSDVSTGFHPEGTASIKALLDHEIGHQIDAMFGIRNHPDFITLYNSLNTREIARGLSEYATFDSAELIAEAWSEYLNNPNPRSIARQVGDLIMRIYSRSKKP